jgi:DNA invertase Pin-like site-specific DNA recombinase
VTHAIAYYRVSTQKQGKSGLGLQAQKQAVADYAHAQSLTITAEYTEIETGTNKRQRAEITKAMQAAKASNSVLLIAKLDRLARNVAFLSGLMESGVNFVACDNPNATPFTLHILAAVAEHEAKMISARTKAALQAKLARDGEWRDTSGFTNEKRMKGGATMKQKAQAAHSVLLTDRIKALRGQGLGYAKIAKELNRIGETTRRGQSYQPMTVKRILARL